MALDGMNGEAVQSTESASGVGRDRYTGCNAAQPGLLALAREAFGL